MNGTPILTTTQQLLVWTLLGLLLSWLIIFAVLAFRRPKKDTIEPDDTPTPSRSFPALSAPATLQIMTSPPVGVARPVAAMAAVESSSDAGYFQQET